MLLSLTHQGCLSGKNVGYIRYGTAPYWRIVNHYFITVNMGLEIKYSTVYRLGLVVVQAAVQQGIYIFCQPCR